MNNFDLKKYLAEGKLHEEVDESADLHNRLIAAAEKVGGKLEGYDQTPINGKIKFYVDLGDGNPSYMNGFEMDLKTGNVSPSTPDEDAIEMNKIFSILKDK